MIIGIILFLLGAIIAILFANTKTKEENGNTNLFFTLIAVAFITVGTSFVTIELVEGLPKDTYGTFGGCMPPEDLPLTIKMINVEDNFMHATMAPYNDQSELQLKYYRIPIEKIEDLNSIEAGTIVINDNGILRPFLITSEV